LNGDLILAVALLLPVAGALLIAATGKWPNLREAVTLSTGGLLLLAVMTIYSDLEAGARPALVLVETLPGLPIALAVEPLGMLFALLASFLWIVTSLYAIGYMRAHGEQHQTRFYVCFAVAIASTMGIALAANMFTLFIFYEVLTLSTYPLVGASTWGCFSAPPSACSWWRSSGPGRSPAPSTSPPAASSRVAHRQRSSRCCSRSTCSASARPPSCPSTAGCRRRWWRRRR
jgi:hypothetical protein